MSRPVELAVVGHTNTGKTSLLRTLAQDVGFGEVDDRAGTTRHVEGLQLLVDGQPLAALYDTPGLEDAAALRETLAALDEPALRHDRPALIARFLEQAADWPRFEQEAKVLRQLLVSDAALYVIDARDPVLPKHLDELDILARCGKPLLPVFNFVADGQARSGRWREALARLGLHAALEFDTVAPPFDGEARLFAALATLLHAQAPTLQRLLAARCDERRQRRQRAHRLIAEVLVRLAALRVSVQDDPQALAEGEARLQTLTQALETEAIAALLQLYRFRPGDVRTAGLPFADGRWEHTLFDPEALREMGLRLGSAAAKGAALGAGLDLMVGGLSLGAGAALGALAGGLWQTVDRYGSQLAGRLRGQRQLGLPTPLLALCARRFLRLLEALSGRGHAAHDPVRLGATSPDDEATRLPPPLARARVHPAWYDPHCDDPAREQALLALSAWLAGQEAPRA